MEVHKQTEEIPLVKTVKSYRGRRKNRTMARMGFLGGCDVLECFYMQLLVMYSTN